MHHLVFLKRITRWDEIISEEGFLLGLHELFMKHTYLL